MSKIKDLDRVQNAILLLLAFKTFRFGQQENVQGPDAQIDPLRAKHVGPATLKAIEWFCRTHFISYSHCFSNKKKQNASSSLLPSHFSLLGIQPSLRHLEDHRCHAPPPHRRFTDQDQLRKSQNREAWRSETLVRGVRREDSCNNFESLFIWALFGSIFVPIFLVLDHGMNLVLHRSLQFHLFH
ncbi:hypothetical protein ES319_A06G033200v1 [Gossypium barbadense]|uniref:Uncharacterized protein n=1 Tax=Gossypium barbadense TaxID=3634 RepID=A0A5J5V9U8_GOSBA|nr:hypothetical protein ES319_A06G033200v1 [Gossypium barbadense]